jgi:hypothetical protein
VKRLMRGGNGSISFRSGRALKVGAEDVIAVIASGSHMDQQEQANVTKPSIKCRYGLLISMGFNKTFDLFRDR